MGLGNPSLERTAVLCGNPGFCPVKQISSASTAAPLAQTTAPSRVRIA